MSIKRLLPLAGLLALAACQPGTGPNNCFVSTEEVIGVDESGQPITAVVRRLTPECQDLNDNQ